MIQQISDEAYQSHILQGVSRTFALTIPQLPSPLCTVVSNAYLLCRIADTIEDEPHLTLTQKKQFSQEFIHVVTGDSRSDLFSQALFPLLSNDTLAAERELIFNMPRVIRLTHSYTTQQRHAISRCVRIMATGMGRFQHNQHDNTITGLKNQLEMDRYCYYVAGVVGEMLTDLFCDYSPLIARHQESLQKLAVSFGQALQMTNILKDIWEDYHRGVCWLPCDVFALKGFDLRNLSPHHYTPAFGAGLAELIGNTHKHLHNALRYIILIPPDETGIRRFCLWAVSMAILTLRRINKRRDFCTGQQVKISRKQVKTAILVSNLCTRNDTCLRLMFYLLTRTLPPIQK